MKVSIRNCIIMLLLVVVLVVTLSSAASAAEPIRYVYYYNQDGSLVMVDYLEIIQDLITGSGFLRDELRVKLAAAYNNDRFFFLEFNSNRVINYYQAVFDLVNYPQAYTNPVYWWPFSLSPVLKLSINPLTGRAEEVPISTIIVESVSAINRTTIQVTLAPGASPAEAADKSNYTVSVGGTAVPVTAAVYNSATRVATLTVNLAGLSGACVVNGVVAAVNVPPLPVFSSITTAAGSFKVILNFNTNVYDFAGDLAAANFSVTTNTLPNTVTAVEVADSVGNSQLKVTITLENPMVGGTVTSVTLNAAGAAKIRNIWGEATTAATRWQLTPEDTVAPSFTGVRAVAGGYSLFLDFSEAVHTGGNNLTATIAPDADVRVTVNGVRVPSQTGWVAGIVATDAKDSIKIDLALPLTGLLSSGNVIEVTLDAGLQNTAVAKRIRDLSNNVFEGQRTRTAVLVADAGLKNAGASTLLYNGEQDLDLSVTMDGALAAGDKITVYLKDLADNGFIFTNGTVTVTGSTGTAFIAVGNTMTFTAPAGGVPHNTELIFTIKQGLLPGRYAFTGIAAVNNSPHRVIFQRSDVGTTAEANCAVVQGFSTFVGPLPTLVSSKDKQAFNFSFKVEGALAAGKKITINMSALQAAGVSFDYNLAETLAASSVTGLKAFGLTFEGGNLTITALDAFNSGDIVSINLRKAVAPATEVANVAFGAAGEHNLIISRNDSGVAAAFKVKVLGNITDVTATSLGNNYAGQFQIFTFKLDGGLDLNQTATIKIRDSLLVGKIVYGGLATWDVPAGNGAITAINFNDDAANDVAVTFTAYENIPAGTVIVARANAVDTTSAPLDTLVDVEVTRQDTVPPQSGSATFEISLAPLAISSVSIKSNNADPALAKAGDTITVTLVTNNTVVDVSPTGVATVNQVIMPGNADSANPFVDNAPGTIVEITVLVDAADADGLTTFAFTITDALADTMVIIEADITDGSSVTVDTTAPVIEAVALKIAAGDGGVIANGDSIEITFSEPMHADLKAVVTGGVGFAFDGSGVPNRIRIDGLGWLNLASTAITIGVDNLILLPAVTTVAWSAGNTVLTITFDNVGVTGTTFTKALSDMSVANIDASAKDLAGNILAPTAIPAASVSVGP